MTPRNILCGVTAFLVLFTPLFPAFSASASLTLIAKPAARVWIDDKPYGSTPVTNLKVTSGTHRVRYVNEKMGIQKEFNIKVPAGEHLTCTHDFKTAESQCLKASQVEAKGTAKITLISTPAAEVYVDGVLRGNTPLENLSVTAGEHQIEFRHSKYGSEKRAVDLLQNQKMTVEVVFQE